jgi:cation transport ATPase
VTILERRFEVEHAGCPSCAERIQGALAPLGTVDEITIDETADTAAVSMRADKTVGEERINSALAAASAGAGHDYRVLAGSWAESIEHP